MSGRNTSAPAISSPGAEVPWWCYILLATAAVGWSLNGVLIKSATMGAVAIAFYRSAVAAVFLSPVVWRRRRRVDRSSLDSRSGQHCF